MADFVFLCLFGSRIFRWGYSCSRVIINHFDIYIHNRLSYIDKTPPAPVKSFVLHQLPTSPWS
jgi:hypothetical protein